MATLRLVPVSGPPIDVVKDQSMVGRDPSCEIVVTDGSVSRRHARLEQRAGRLVGGRPGQRQRDLRQQPQGRGAGAQEQPGAPLRRAGLPRGPAEDPEATVATPFLADDSATVMAPSTPPPVPPAAPPPPPPPTPKPRRRPPPLPARRRRRRRPRPPSAAAAKERFRPAAPGRARPADARGRAAGEEGQEPALLGRDRLLRLPAARRAPRRRHRRRRLHGHEGRGRRRPRVAREVRQGQTDAVAAGLTEAYRAPAHRGGGRRRSPPRSRSRRTRPSCSARWTTTARR